MIIDLDYILRKIKFKSLCISPYFPVLLCFPNFGVMKYQYKKVVVLVVFLFAVPLAAKASYDSFFTDNTLRVDYFQTGTASREIISLDQIYREGEWPGTRSNLIDTLNLGQYLLKVYDLATNQLIFSHGFASIFGEWQTTDEAISGTFRTMHGTARLPFPKRSVQFIIAKRNKKNVFINQFFTTIDPGSRFVNCERKSFPYKTNALISNGAPKNKVDLLIMGDGYTKEDLKKFHRDVKRYTDDLFAVSPFKERAKDFNVWTIDVISKDSGIDEPRKKRWKQTALGTSYNSLDLARYVLSLSNKEIHDIAAMVPYDNIYILVNSSRYGGGGIFNCMATCYTGSEKGQPDWWSDYVFVHEFGHAFAGLADEYYTSNVAYNDLYPPDVEPWEPNITTLTNKEHLKWAALIKPGTPIPTPWEKARYDSLLNAVKQLDKKAADYEEKDKLLHQQAQAILNSPKYQGIVGCFEGAGYASQGIYRPAIDCRMFSKSLGGFCPVCRNAIERMINFQVK